MRPRTRDGEDMKTRISALMDGELEGHEVAETLRALAQSGVAR
jgi:negative regulator of sigma E activity